MTDFIKDINSDLESKQQIRFLKRIIQIIFFLNILLLVHSVVEMLWVNFIICLACEVVLLGLLLLLRKKKLDTAIVVAIFFFFPAISFLPLTLGRIDSLHVAVISVFLGLHFSSKSYAVTALNGVMMFLSLVGLQITTSFYPDYKFKDPLVVEILVSLINGSLIVSALVFSNRNLNRYQQHLKGLLEFLRNISDLNPDFIFAKDQSRRFTFVNDSVQTLFGLSANSLWGKTDREVGTFQGDQDPFESDDQEILEGKTNQKRIVEQIMDVDGKKKWVEVVKKAIRDRDGNIGGLLGIARDITDRKEAEEALAASETRYRNIVEFSPTGIAIEKGGFFLQVNQQMCQITGYSEKELLKNPFVQLVDEQYKKLIYDQWELVSQKKLRSFGLEVEFCRKDGSKGYALIRVAPLYDGVGDFVENLVTIADISELRERDQQLERSLAELSGTLESTADGIMVVELNGGILNYNRKFLEIWEVPEDLQMVDYAQEIYQHILSCIPDPESFQMRIQEIINEPEKGSRDILKLKSGKVLERITRPLWVKGKVEGRVWSFHDITQIEQANEVIKDREVRFRGIFEHNQFGLATDKNHVMTSVNDALCEMTGYDRTELEGMNVFDIVEIENQEGGQEAMEAFTNGEVPFIEMSVKINRKDGSIGYGLVRKSILLDAKGEQTENLATVADITELRNSQVRYQNLFVNSFDAIISFDSQSGNITDCNDVACQVYLRQKDELLKTIGVLSLFPGIQPDGRESFLVWENWMEISGKGVASRFEFVHLRANGDLFETETTIIPNPEVANEFMMLVKDISGEKKIERALVDNQNLLQAVISGADQAIYVVGRDHKIKLFNEVANKWNQMLLGFGIQNELNLVQEIPEGPLRERFLSFLNRGLEGTTFTDYSFWKNEEEEFHFLTTVAPIRDTNEEIIATAFISKDITSFKSVERALRDSEEKYRVLFEKSPLGLVLVDTEKTKTGIDCNDEWVKILKADSKDQAVKTNMLKLSPPVQPDGRSSAESLSEYMREYRDGFKPTTFEWEFKDFEGERIYTEVSYIPVEVGGEFLTMLLIRDISRAKKQEELIQEQVTNLDQQNRQLTEFSYIVSHNFRGAVANILGLTETYDRINLDDEENVEIIEMIEKMAVKLDTSIKDLNMMLSLRNNKENIKQEVNLMEIMEDVETELQLPIIQTESRISCDFSELNQVFAVKAYLKSIFYNLISNAIKYRHKERKPEIQITSFQSGKEVGIRIEDNGLGIDLNRFGGQIFSLYKRFHDHVEGKGLGLYLVKIQTESMGGQIKVESELDKGTAFTLTLPNH